MSTANARTVGDTLTLSGTAKDLVGPVVLPAGAAGVVHVARPDSTTFQHPATLNTASSGAGVGAWVMTGGTVADLTVPGDYVVELQVTYPDTTVVTFGRGTFPVQSQLL
ncbi:hypothetical protein [Tessaracoccus sp.]